MEKTMRFLSIAALALVGAVMTGCSSEDNFTAQPQQQVADKGNVVTVTATVGLGEQAGTRKLTIDGSKGVKTFAEGDQIAVIYENESGTMVKAETAALTADDITAEGKSAKITVTMNKPKASGTVKYIYPAAMAGETDVDYAKLNSQDGSLDNLGKKFDLAVYDGTLTAEKALPASATLTNKLAILALTIKDNATTPNDLTNSITSLSIGDGTNTYSVTREAAAGPIYVAIKPTNSATIGVNATDGTTHYYKELTSKTYAEDNGYSVSWKMAQGAHLSAIAADFTANDDDVLTGKLGNNVKISIAAGATVTLKNVQINQDYDWDSGDYAGITCVGDATIILEGTNTVKGFYEDYPGIYVPDGNTLTIDGTGSLTANGGGYGAGIGGGNAINCGNIEIKGGEITADGGSDWSGSAGIGGGGFASCGNITISGGTVTANGGDYGAGIGGGQDGICGTITISGGTVTASGNYYGAGIGCGYSSNGHETRCGNILIKGGTVTATGGENAAGIGGGFGDGYDTTCGTITINNTVTKLTATKGYGAGNSIGPAGIDEDLEYCGKITIGGTEYWGDDGYGSDYKNGGDTYLTQDQIIYQP